MEVLFTPFDILFKQAADGLDVLLPSRDLDDQPLLVVMPFQPWLDIPGNAYERLAERLPKPVREERVVLGVRVWYATLRDWEHALEIVREEDASLHALPLASRFLLEHGVRLFSVWRAEATPLPLRYRVPVFRAERVVEDDPITFIPHARVTFPLVRQHVRGVLGEEAFSWQGWGEAVQSEADVIKRFERVLLDQDVLVGMDWDVLMPRLVKRAEALHVPFKPGVDFTPPFKSAEGWRVRGTVLVDARAAPGVDATVQRLLEDSLVDAHVSTTLRGEVPVSMHGVVRMLHALLPRWVKLAQMVRSTVQWVSHASPGRVFTLYAGGRVGKRDEVRIPRRFVFLPSAFAQPAARVRFPTLFADTALRLNAAADTLFCSCCKRGSVWHCEKRESRLLRRVESVREEYARLDALVKADARLAASLKAAERDALRVLLEGVEEAFLLPGSSYYSPESVRVIRAEMTRLVRSVQGLIVAFDGDAFYVKRVDDIPLLVREVERFTRRRMPYTVDVFDRAVLIRHRGLSLAWERDGRLRFEGFASRLEGLTRMSSLARDVLVKRMVEGVSRVDILRWLEEYASRIPFLPLEDVIVSIDVTRVPRSVWREHAVREALRKARENVLFYVKLVDDVLLLDDLPGLGEDRVREALDVAYYAEHLVRPLIPFLRAFDIPLEEVEEAVLKGLVRSGVDAHRVFSHPENV